MFKKLLYTLLGISIAFTTTVYAVQISVPSAPVSGLGGGFMLQSLANGNWIATSTSNLYIGSLTATSTGNNTFFGNLIFPNLTGGALYIDGAGQLRSHATTSTSVAYQDVWRDGNANVLANNFFPAVLSTVSNGGTVVMTPASARYQILTGSSNHTYQQPNGNAAGMTTGATWDFNNNSSGILTVTTHGGAFIASVPSGGFDRVILTDNSTSEGSWETHAYLGHNNVSGTGTLGLGTTSPAWLLQVSSSTASNTFKPQFAISDQNSASGLKHLTFSYQGGNFYLATATDQLATSSQSLLRIDANGFPYFSSLSGVGCIQATASGKLTNTGTACGSGGGSFPFSADNTYNQVVYSTSTPSLWFKSGLFASSTSYFGPIGVNTAPSPNTEVQIDGITSYGQLVLSDLAQTANFVGLGISGSAGQIITGDAAGDFDIWTNGSMNFSANNGGSVQMKLNTIGNLSFPYSSSTIYSSFINASSTHYLGGGLGTCSGSNFLQYSASNFFTCGTPATGSTFPFTPLTNFGVNTSATTTPLWLQGSTISLMASSTAWFDNITVASTSIATSTITNLGGKLDATYFSGSDIGAKINSAYTAASAGSVIYLPAGKSYSFSTRIDLVSAYKPVVLDCQGSTLTWTGTATSTVLNNVRDVPYLPYNDGIKNCNLKGSAGTSVGIQVGGSNGAPLSVVENNHITGFHIGIRQEANTYLNTYRNNVLETNDQNFYAESANNSGENVLFDHNNISDCNTTDQCFYAETNAFASVTFISDSFDHSQVFFKDGNTDITFIGGHFENTNAANTTAYTPIVTSPGSFTNMVINGTMFFNDGADAAHSPPQYILNAGNLTLLGVSVQSNIGGVIVPSFVNNYGGDGQKLQATGFMDINASVSTLATTSVNFNVDEDSGGRVAIGTTSPKTAAQLNIYNLTLPQISLESNDLDNFWTERGIGNNFYIATATPNTYATSSNSALTINKNGWLGIGTTTPGFGLSVAGGLMTTASSSSMNGFDLQAGCFAIRGTCISGGGGSGTVTSITNGTGLVNNGTSYTTTGTITAGIATATTPVIGNLGMWESTGSGATSALIGNVATGTITCTGTASCGGGSYVLGANLTINATGSASPDPFSHPFPWTSATTSSFIIGTSTISVSQSATLTLASSSAPQLALGDATPGDFLWTFRNAGQNIYLSTTSVSGLATTTTPAITISKNGEIGISSSTPLGILAGNTTHALGGIGGMVWNFGDSVITHSNNLTYSYKTGASDGALAFLGFNVFINAGGGAQLIDTAKGGWEWKVDNRDGTTAPDLRFTSVDTSVTELNVLVLAKAGNVSMSTSSQARILNIGSDPASTNATTTFKVNKIQFEGDNSAGSEICAFVTSSNAWAFKTGACNP